MNDYGIRCGDRFGRFVVKAIGLVKSAKAACECLCDCGNSRIVICQNLRNGSKSCGCEKADKRPKVGERFGMLVVTEQCQVVKTGDDHWEYSSRCLCDCGAETVVPNNRLKTGGKKSCGCKKYKHKMTNSPEYISWSSAKTRCFIKSSREYKSYGGAGITMCEKWKNSFQSFFDDLGPRPPGTTLDRIDSSIGYFPGNCRWADWVTQETNKANVIKISHNGELLPISELSKRFKIPISLIYSRHKRGVSGDGLFVPTNRDTRKTGNCQEYHCWQNLKSRCLRKSNPEYKNYGGIGVTMESSWVDSYQKFLNDVGNSPGRGYSLARINPNGNYTADNVKWMTHSEVASRKKNTIIINAFNKSLSPSEWERETGVKKHIILSRVRLGWSPERAVSEKTRKKKVW